VSIATVYTHLLTTFVAKTPSSMASTIHDIDKKLGTVCEKIVM